MENKELLLSSIIIVIGLRSFQFEVLTGSIYANIYYGKYNSNFDYLASFLTGSSSVSHQ